jgi:hypothetical protein
MTSLAPDQVLTKNVSTFSLPVTVVAAATPPSLGSSSTPPPEVGYPIRGDLLEQHILRLGHRSLHGYTGYDEEFLVLE